MTPTSHTTLHVARSTRVMGKHSGRNSYYGKIRPTAPAPFWAWPNNVSRLCVAQARGLLSVYKSRGTPFYPFTCARTVGAAPTATLSRAEEGAEEKPKHKMAKATP